MTNISPSISTAGITLTGNAGSYTLATGGYRGSTAGVFYGATISGHNDTLVVYGKIAGYKEGIDVTGANNAITIKGAGQILDGQYQIGGFFPANYEEIVFHSAAANGLVVNYGTIAQSEQSGAPIPPLAAVSFVDGGIFSNKSTGTVTQGGAAFFSVAGTVVNAGLINGATYSGGPASLSSRAVWLQAGGSVINQAGGRLVANGGVYGVQIQGGAGTIENAGTISNSGHTAVMMGPSLTNLFILDSTGVDLGIVNGGAGGHNTFEFGTAAALTTYSNTGNITNFNTIAFLNGSTWDVQGNAAFWAGETLGNVGLTDTIDITGFTVTSSGTGVHAGTTSLVLTDAVGAHATVHFATATPSFTIVSGAFGTELLGICFCPGTKIRTPDGEVQVEDLSVGDAVVTLGGNA